MLKRRLFLLLAVLLPLLGFAQAKSVPYFSQIGGASKLDADWTVYNVNGDEKTWINDASSSNYSSITAVLTSSLRHPKIFIKEFCDFLVPCH